MSLGWCAEALGQTLEECQEILIETAKEAAKGGRPCGAGQAGKGGRAAVLKALAGHPERVDVTLFHMILDVMKGL